MTTRVFEWANGAQQWMFNAGPQPTLLVGGFDSAKTFGGVLKLLYLLNKYPKSRGAIIRSMATQMRKTTNQTFYELCPPEMYDRGRRNDQDGFCILNNGSRIDFVHLKSQDSLNVLKGLELNFALVDQAEGISDEAWEILEVRVGRWSHAEVTPEMLAPDWPWHTENGDPIPPRYLFATANPTDESHWLYLRFGDTSPEREKWKMQGYQCRRVDSRENKFGSKELRRIYNAKDEEFQRRYVRGEWGNPEGQLFDIPVQSLLEPTPALIDRIRRTMKHHRSMDHGDTAPVCVLNEATDHDGNIFVWREYYVANATVSEHRKALYMLSREDPKMYSELADPSIFAKSRGRTATKGPEWSVADEWQDVRPPQMEHTAIRWTAAPVGPKDQSDLMERARLKEYLLIDPNHRHPITGELGAPHIYFVKKTPAYPNGCDMVIREIRAQKRKLMVIGGKNIWTDERDDTVVDHAYDTIKYHVISRPSLGPTPPPQALKTGLIPIVEYQRADAEARVRRRREERLVGVASHGWG